jgi:hypothetical protein
MTVSKRNLDLGRHVFGVAAIASGLITLGWHDYNGWHQLYVVYACSAALILGGAAIQFRRIAKAGAALLAAAYLVFTLLCVPQIFVAPRIFNSWGNFFEQFSLATGAAMVCARWSSAWSRSPETVARTGRILFGICVASFTLEQAIYLRGTVSLVPKWVPSQMFWAITTTFFFALAAVAFLANWKALLAARLLTVMLVSFGVLVWIPLTLSHPFSHANWSENAETFGIAGAAWILADLLSEHRPQ